MKQVSSSQDPLIFTLGEPRLNLVAMGAIFFILGSLSVGGYVVIDFSQIDSPPEFTLVVGIIFLILGTSIAASLNQVRVDKATGYVETIRGVIVPFQRKTLPLSDFNKITLTRDKRQVRKSRKVEVLFVVRLDGKQPLLCCEFKQFEQAQFCVEKLVSYLRLPVEDSTSGAIERREVEEFI